MTLSQLQEPIWHRRACHDCMPQFNQHALEVKTMIKPEAVFRKMPWGKCEQVSYEQKMKILVI
ncbi:hypothetical protein DA11_19215 [Aeromonas caviae]|nr:hypothetical protein DA11_19215 [Aeromonas caviae]